MMKKFCTQYWWIGLLFIVYCLSFFTLFLQKSSNDRDLSTSLHDVIDKNSSSVVQIYTEDQIFLGLGVSIEENLVLTSKHFLNIGEKYSIRGKNSWTLFSHKITFHPTRDLALLQFSSSFLTYAPVVSSQAFVKTGDLGIASGILSVSKNLTHHLVMISWLDADSGDEKIGKGLILTDRAFQSGYSGGPLFNFQGEVIGIHTAYASREQAGWSTPVDQWVLGDMKKI